MNDGTLEEFYRQALEALKRDDPKLYGLLEEEYQRQTETLALVASCCPTDPSVLACEGSFASNVTAEGYPGARYHAGCTLVDRFEALAIERAKRAFKARYANVQPHSATTANQTVMTKLLRPGDTILGMELDAGGHLTHGARVSISGQYFRAVGYGLTPDGRIDYAQVEELARRHRPKLIICGTTAYPRRIDFERFRAIADEVGAYLLADISHLSALVIAGEHPSPIDAAHVTTTCTHKQLYGPRGGLILLGKDGDTPGPNGAPLHKLIETGVFPFFQGAPIVNKIVAKARALAAAMTPEFRALARRIVRLSQALAAALTARGVRVVAGGTDNHIVLVDVLGTFGLTGIVAQQALEACGITVNKNRIPGDRKPAFVASGIRIGSNTAAVRGFGPPEMDHSADLICRVLRGVTPRDDRRYDLDPALRDAVREEVRALCRRFPIRGYPVETTPAY